jgi:hypothetical protein
MDATDPRRTPDPNWSLSDFDRAISEVQKRMGEIDGEVAVIEYLSEVGQRIRDQFLATSDQISRLQNQAALTPQAVAQAFESQVLPPLRETLAASKQVHLASPRLKQLHSHAVSALQEDVQAFEVLVIAYRNQDHQRMAAGRALRDSSAQHRAAWIREALTMGQDVGLYDSPPPT